MKKRIFIFAATVLAVITVMQITVFASDARVEYVKPSYAAADITGILEKSSLSDADYETLYLQTGLTKIGVDRCMARGGEGVARIKSIQDGLFSDYTVRRDCFAPFCRAYGTGVHNACCYLENGDIIVTSATHIAGVEAGHAGLVTDAAHGVVVQAVSYFTESKTGSVRDFTGRLNFLVLSPVAPEEVKANAANYAKSKLTGKRYGICPDKRDCSRTHCAHLVWYAYKRFGIDLDCNGGYFVTPKNIANSPLVCVVQVFGFDLTALWR